MKILVIGSDGFVGRYVVGSLAAEHDVFTATRKPTSEQKNHSMDLLDRTSIVKVLQAVRPEAIIDCAGIVSNNDAALQNQMLVSNLLNEIVACNLMLKRIIICGSAAEYGVVKPQDLPVNEETPLRATSGYGLSKAQETSQAVALAKEHHLPVVIARIFNPVGVGMNPRLLIPQLLKQLAQIQAGHRQTIEVARLDTQRDYVDMRDVAEAIKLLVTREPQETVYNIGSGVGTTVAEVIDVMLKNSTLQNKPQIVETLAEPEPLVAVQADITRITQEFDWQPMHTLEQTIKELLDAEGR